MSEPGLVILLTGDGKGKTTSSLGIAMRAVGSGMRVIMIQFVKGPIATGEMNVIKKLAPQFELRRFGSGFIFPERGGPTPADIAIAREGFEFARKALASGDYQLVILDEINNAVKVGLFNVQEVVDLVKSRKPEVHVVLTGRDAPPELIDLADTVTEMKLIKHHYQKGRPAVPGIEY